MTAEIFLQQFGIISICTWTLAELLRKCPIIKKFGTKIEGDNLAFFVGMILTIAGLATGYISASSPAEYFAVVIVSIVAIQTAKTTIHDETATPLGL